MAINIPIITTFSDSGLAAANKKISMFGKQFPGIGLAIAGVTAAVGAVGVAAYGAVQKASDLNEQISKTGVIFGDTSKQVENFAKTANRSLGLSTTAALTAATTFATFGKAAGLAGNDLVNFSTDFVTLASDLASFNNTTTDQAISAIGSALRGESEPLRAYGVLLNDASLKAAAMELGIYSGSGALGQQAKILAAQKVIYKQTGDAQGDFTRTSGGLANQQKILSATLENVQTNLGTALLPLFIKLVRFFNEKVTPALEEIANAFGDGGLAFGIQVALSKMGSAGPIIAGIFKGIAVAVANTVNTVYKLVKAFEAVYYFTTGQFSKGIAATKATFDNLIDVDKLKGQFDGFINGIGTVDAKLANNAYFTDLMGKNVDNLGKVVKNVTPDVEGLGDKVGGATKKVESFAAALKAKLTEAVDGAKGVLKDAQEAFIDFATTTADAIKQAFSFSDAQTAGAETGGGFLDGLKSQVAGIVGYTDKLQALLQTNLSRDAFQMVLDAGQEAGSAIADQLISGGQTAIDETNSLVDAANRAADKVGLNGATKWYQAGVDQAAEMVAGLQAELDKLTPKLMAKMDALALKMKRKVSIDVYVNQHLTDIGTKLGIPAMANGGIITQGPTLALIGEAGPEAVIPLNQMGNMGGGGGITVNVNGGLATSAEVGRAVVDAIRQFNQVSGPANIRVA
jgi:hypothetical protein